MANFAVWDQGKWNVTECIAPVFAVLHFKATMELKTHFTWVVSLCLWTYRDKSKYWDIQQNALGNLVSLATLICTYGEHSASYFYCPSEQCVVVCVLHIQVDEKRWTQFRTSIFPELYMVCE